MNIQFCNHGFALFFLKRVSQIEYTPGPRGQLSASSSAQLGTEGRELQNVPPSAVACWSCDSRHAVSSSRVTARFCFPTDTERERASFSKREDDSRLRTLGALCAVRVTVVFRRQSPLEQQDRNSEQTLPSPRVPFWDPNVCGSRLSPILVGTQSFWVRETGLPIYITGGTRSNSVFQRNGLYLETGSRKHAEKSECF